MPPHKTSTAYMLGVKNALVCGIGVLVIWFLIGEAISQITDTPIGDSLGIAFVLLWGIASLCYLAVWLCGRWAGGQTLLDCGPSPLKELLIVNAVIYLMVGIMGASAVGRAGVGSKVEPWLFSAVICLPVIHFRQLSNSR